MNERRVFNGKLEQVWIRIRGWGPGNARFPDPFSQAHLPVFIPEEPGGFVWDAVVTSGQILGKKEKKASKQKINRNPISSGLFCFLKKDRSIANSLSALGLLFPRTPPNKFCPQSLVYLLKTKKPQSYGWFNLPLHGG